MCESCGSWSSLIDQDLARKHFLYMNNFSFNLCVSTTPVVALEHLTYRALAESIMECCPLQLRAKASVLVTDIEITEKARPGVIVRQDSQ